MADSPDLILYSSSISNASARLRIALNLKQLPYKLISIRLDRGEQHSANFEEINPNKTVPLLMHTRSDGETINIGQSIAALEYLDEAFPSSLPLMPGSPAARARVRTLVGILATDAHPLLTHRVAKAIPSLLPGAKIEEGNIAWDRHWISEGLSNFEKELRSRDTSVYCVGDSITLADVVLMPEYWMARRIGVNDHELANIRRIVKTLGKHEEISQEKQQPEQ